MSYAFTGEFTEDVKTSISEWLQTQLTTLLGEADPVLIEYVTTMVVNRKNMSEMSTDLVEFFGESECAIFIERCNNLN